MRLRDEFLSIASHELRTPLASLQLAVQGHGADALAAPTADADRVTALVNRQVHRLDTLIGLLLDVSRIRRGRLQLERRHIDLCQVVRDATALLAQDLVRSGSALEVHAPAPVCGCWDGPRRLVAPLRRARPRPLHHQTIVDEHGGRIHVESDQGRTTFTIDLPEAGA